MINSAQFCALNAFLQYSDVSLCGYLRKLEKMLSISKKACDALSKRRETTKIASSTSPSSRPAIPIMPMHSWPSSVWLKNITIFTLAASGREGGTCVSFPDFCDNRQ